MNISRAGSSLLLSEVRTGLEYKQAKEETKFQFQFSHFQGTQIYIFLAMTAFEEFGVLPEIGKAVDDMGWTLPTDIQSEAIPLILGGGDVLLAAETGSGKTGAFCLPVLQITWESLKVHFLRLLIYIFTFNVQPANVNMLFHR